MQPYVIRQGDYLALLAYKFDFDADTVWGDPANSDLRKLRPNPNLLWPTDVLYISRRFDQNTSDPRLGGRADEYLRVAGRAEGERDAHVCR